MMKTAITAIVATSVLASSAIHASAQDYPNKSLRMIVAAGPGGSIDILGRIVANELSTILGQTVVVENRGGASGAIGNEAAMRSAPDGYTILAGSTGTALNLANNTDTGGSPFDINEVMTPLAALAAPSYLVTVGPSVDVEDPQGLLELIEAGGVSFGSSGVGSASHLTGRLFEQMSGATLRHIPYTSTGQAVTDLLAGEIDIMFAPAPTVSQHVEDGTLRVLALTGSASQLADYPSLDETILPGFSATGWFGLFLPANVPDEITEQLGAAVNEALTSEFVITRFAEQGAEPAIMTPSEWGQFVNEDLATWLSIQAE